VSEAAILMGVEPNNPLNIFFCYAAEDHHWYQRLDSHLSNLQQQKLIRLWDESHISPGSEKGKERLTLFNHAHILLLFISPSFLKSCYQDIEEALALQKAGKARVIPLLVRPGDYDGAPFQSLRCLPTNEVPITKWPDPDEALQDVVKGLRLVINELRESSHKPTLPFPDNPPQPDPELLALVTNQSGFMDDRLESFVGREKELADIRHKIEELMPKGGYITITGQAGQGKSSVIAKLIQFSDPQKVAHHFIPLNPGPDHQVVLLRNIMARLILKYRLSSLYVSSESRPALRDFFPKVLKEIAAVKGQEVIFIDGLDQLEEDANGIRDLSFLPTRLPPGIVFVLGTRPNDTLRPLELLNPRIEYPLPNMSRTDFDLILARRGVTLKSSIADRFYDAMEQNALYLDLVAKELQEATILQPDEIIQRLSSNPEHLFTLAIERLQRQPMLWEKVIYPAVAILLVAREPLHRQHLAQLLSVPDYRCREGLTKLGGLVIVDGQQKCSLFHLKLRDYLRQNEQTPSKEYLFSLQEEINWHKVMADWCEVKDLNRIWEEVQGNGLEQGRRKYAQQHYITHLYYAGEHEKLFHLLDQGEFGQRKLQIDPSTRSYAQDLDLGREAAANDKVAFEVQLERLPRLWRYSLLRCSLASRVDQYPLSAFKLLVLLGRQQEALGLAELITKPEQKVEVLSEIASQVAEKSESQTEALKIVLRAREITGTIRESDARDKVLCEVGSMLTQLQAWESAWEVLSTVNDGLQQSKGIRDLANVLIQKQNWDDAKQVIDCIWVSQQRGEALDDLSKALAQAHLWEQAHTVIDSIWDSQQRVKALVNLGLEFVQAGEKEQAEKVWIEVRRVVRSIRNREQQNDALCHMVNVFVQAQLWDWAAVTAYSIWDEGKQVEALKSLGEALIQAWYQEETTVMWMEARQVINIIDSIWDGQQKVKVLANLGLRLVQAGQEEQAEKVWIEVRRAVRSIQNREQQNGTLYNLMSVFLQIQAWDWAGVTAYSIMDGEKQARALSMLGAALVQTGHGKEANVIWVQASEVINSIQEREEKAGKLRELVTTLARTNEIISSVQGGKKQAGALQKLAAAVVKAKLWKDAKVVLNSIQDSGRQAEALRELARALVRDQQWKEAKEVINSIPDREKQARVEALRELAAALRGDRQSQEARPILAEVEAQEWREARDVINRILDKEQQAEALRELETTLAEAREVLNSILDKEKHAEAVHELAMALVQAQKWREARTVIDSIARSKSYIDLLCALGVALAQAQQWQEANAIWAEAREMLNRIEDREKQVRALRELGIALVQNQCQEEANVMWAEARKGITSIRDREKQAQAIRDLWTSLVQAQQWEEAREVINSIQQAWQRTQALRELARALAQVQRWAEAREVINSIPDREQQPAALRELGNALAQAQQWEEAMEVINSIQQAWQRRHALLELEAALVHQQWLGVREVVNSIPDSEQQADAHEMIGSSQNGGQQKRALGKTLTQAQQWEGARQTITVIQQAWLNTETRADAINLFPLATGLVIYQPSLSSDFCKSFTWVDQFMSGGSGDTKG
jgi:hypothetical protein